MDALGWKAAPEQYEPTGLLDQVIAAEEAGFDTLETLSQMSRHEESPPLVSAEYSCSQPTRSCPRLSCLRSIGF
jgi:hypothetical protein